jgi:cob(I)alamin adenosyltransferase
VEAGDTIRTRLYTRTGDRGTTGLAGGSRIEKDSARIRAFGTFDELDAVLGVVLTTLGPAPSNVRTLLLRLQHELFIAQSELAAPAGAKPPAHRIEERHVRRLENEIDEFSATFEPIQTFVLPGGGAAGANLHFARTVARRAERELWTLDRESPQRPEILQWTNRLNDLLFALALSMNRREGIPEIPPDYTV